MKSITRILMTLMVLSMSIGVYSKGNIPYWLKKYKKEYQENPLKASSFWYKNAKLGMFVHLNLASLCERGKDGYMLWKNGMATDKALKFVGVTREEYNNFPNKDMLLFNRYTLKKFNANKICKLAKKAQMKYIIFTTHHLGNCYNFNTKLSSFNSCNAPCQKDLVEDMVKACKKYKIALMLYVPPMISETTSEMYGHNKEYLTELLTQYGAVAGIWFDGIGGFYKHPENYKYLKDIHSMVKKIQPQALISYKEGALGDEDFVSPEHFMFPFNYKFKDKGIEKRFKIRQERWSAFQQSHWDKYSKYKLREINTVMQKCKGRDDYNVDGGWINDEKAVHLTADEVYNMFKYAQFTGSNMVMNIGIKADGSIDKDDVKSLIEFGKMLKTRGYPLLENVMK